MTPNSSLFTDGEKKTSVVFNEVTLRNGTRDGLDGWRIVWATADSVEEAGWSSSQVEAVERFLPHLRQFARVRQAVVDARAQGASAVELLGSRRTGVVQLDRRGRVAAANDVALELLRRKDGLSDRDGFLRAVVPAEDAELSRLLAQALPFAGGVGVSGSMRVSRPRTSLRLELHVSPVDPGRPEERSSRMGALALVVDPARRGAIHVGRVGTVLGLTPAESQVAVWLARGVTIRAIAAATGRSTTTVRWHLRQICAKLGISRQVDLVRLVMSLSDAPEARGSPTPLGTARSKPG